MENFETLRKDWAGLKSGSGGGSDDALLRPFSGNEIVLMLRRDNGKLYFQPFSFNILPPLSMRQLIELGALEKPIKYAYFGTGYSGQPDAQAFDACIGIRNDGSWGMAHFGTEQNAQGIMTGSNLDDLLEIQAN